MAKQISEKQIDLLVERLVSRTQKANEVFLKQIGSSIKYLRDLTPTQGLQLIQMLKYGDDYNNMIKKIAQYSNLNIQDIDEIFSAYASEDQQFAKQFYKYRNKPFIPLDKNKQLRNQVRILADITKSKMRNFTRNKVIGYTIDGQFYNLKDTYNKLLDQAILNAGQGKQTFNQVMYDILKQIGGSGLKTVNYENGRTMRLDSAIRMHLKDGLRTLHNENQMLFGKQFDSDGVEISVHEYPAPDHAEVQGRQFSNKQFENFQNDKKATSYDGIEFDPNFEKHDRRSISQYNCYHTIFPIILGVSEPEYSNEELQRIVDRSKQQVEFDGKKYTMYECTQLQRKLEREIRKQKDLQILGKASDNDLMIYQSQSKITQLTRKYYQLSKKSGLQTELERTRVSGYYRTSVAKPNNFIEIQYAEKNNTIWHSTENLQEIIKDNKIIEPSLAVGKKTSTKGMYGTQFIEFKPEVLENVNKNTILYKGDGGNQFTQNRMQFDNLMKMLKDVPQTYNELKFNENLDFFKYVKKIYIRQDESKQILDFLKQNKIKYEVYNDLRPRPPKRVAKMK